MRAMSTETGADAALQAGNAVFHQAYGETREGACHEVPILVVLAAGYTLKIWEKIPTQNQRIISWALSFAALVMTVYIVSISIDYKNAILRDPFMTDAAKRQIVLAPPQDGK